MTEIMENNDIVSNETIGMNIKRLRQEHGWTQDELAKKIFIQRPTLTKYEKGTLKPTQENIDRLEEVFNLKKGELAKKVAIAIPDTSALLRNRRLLNLLLKTYEQVYIASDVERELSGFKNMRTSYNSSPEDKKKKKIASQTMSLILEYREKYKDKFKSIDSSRYEIPVHGDEKSETDLRIIELAKDLREKKQRSVIIIHNDKDFPVRANDSVQTLYLDEFMALSENTPKNYQQIIDLDFTYDHIEKWDVKAEEMNLDVFLPDCTTLLISCINCNDPEHKSDRGDRDIPRHLITEKLEFLLKHGADPNKPDANQYCHTPLEHCIELRDNDLSYQLFEILLKYNADYNKCSIDETQVRKNGDCKRDSEINEGNTPLMIACWHAKTKIVKRLLEFPDLSINQQDCNGFTALHKCAVQRKNRIEKGLKSNFYEQIYQMLIEHGIDTRIRDRDNHTAQYYWDAGTKALKGMDLDD